MVDEDRIPDIVHDDILKVHIGRSPGRGGWPGLNPDTVHGAGYGAILDKDPDHRLFALVLPKAANTYAVARPTGHGRDIDLLAAVTNGDAVIASLDMGVHDDDPVGSADVDSICVGAISGSSHIDMLEGDVLAAQDIDMEFLAVQGSYALH